MDPYRQGGDPNGRGAGANYNYDPTQRHDQPSSSSRPGLQDPLALPLLTSYPQLQPQLELAGYPDYLVNQGSSGVGISAPMPGHAGYQYSESSLAPWTAPTNVIGNQYQYQPHPYSATVFPVPENSSSVIPHAPVYGAGAYAQQPGSASVFHAAGYISYPHAFVYQPDFSAWGGNANNGSYTSAGLVAPPADANQGASRGPVAGDSNRSRPALRNVWASDLRNAVERATTPGGLEAVVNRVMSNQYNDGVPLMEVAQPRHGETALKELVRLAALHLRPEVLQQLFRCLIDGWKMGQSNGPDLLQHFFTTLPFHRYSIFIHELAVPRFWDMVTSSGYVSILVVCLDKNAGSTKQGITLLNTIVTDTVQIAMDAYGSQLLRTFFQRGRNDALRECITERVEDNLLDLSMDQHGNLVVQACFVPDNRMPSVLLLQRGLQAFLRLHGEQLRLLVQNYRARYVLLRLLRTSLDHAVASAEGTQLAVRILGVGQGFPRPYGDRRAQAIGILKSSR